MILNNTTNGVKQEEAYDFNPVLDKVIGGILLYGIFRVLMKLF